MAHITRLGFNIGGHVDFGQTVGKLYLPRFVVYADIFDFRLFTDVLDDLVDVVPGVEHHGIVGPQADGRSQAVSAGHDVAHQLFLLVADIEIGPGSDGEQEHNPDRDDQFGHQAPANFVYQGLHIRAFFLG